MEAIQKFINENPVIFWLIVVAILLVIVLIVLKVIDVRSKRKPNPKTSDYVEEQSVSKDSKPKQTVVERKTTDEKSIESKPLKMNEDETLRVDSKENAEKSVTKKVAPKLDDATALKKPAKYHVSQNKNDDSEYAKMWRVRKAGSEKTIKFFKTQKEAIDFAQGLADSAGSSVVIHKLDGSIRKQDYSKKDNN